MLVIPNGAKRNEKSPTNQTIIGNKLKMSIFKYVNPGWKALCFNKIKKKLHIFFGDVIYLLYIWRIKYIYGWIFNIKIMKKNGFTFN